MSLRRHPLSMLRDHPALARSAVQRTCRTSGTGNWYRSAVWSPGVSVGTASGVLFVTLEDETGNSNIVMWRSLMSAFVPRCSAAQLLTIKGTVEREGEVIHVVAGFIIDHSHLLDDLVAANSCRRGFDAKGKQPVTAGIDTGTQDPR
ncbi:MAG: hypothetical protein R3E84_23550 [Pseudomonadales bacterium]